MFIGPLGPLGLVNNKDSEPLGKIDTGPHDGIESLFIPVDSVKLNTLSPEATPNFLDSGTPLGM